MLIISIAWVYTVAMMAVAERSVTAGVLTFVLYCALPLSLVLYLQRSKMRKARQAYVAQLRARQAFDPALQQNPAQGESANTADSSAKPDADKAASELPQA